jgi:transposase-like protein
VVLLQIKWKHAVGQVILWLVTWYSRYALSYRDLKEIAAERGFSILDKPQWEYIINFSKNKLKSFAKLLNKNRSKKLMILGQSHYRGRRQKFYWKNRVC